MGVINNTVTYSLSQLQKLGSTLLPAGHQLETKITNNPGIRIVTRTSISETAMAHTNGDTASEGHRNGTDAKRRSIGDDLILQKTASWSEEKEHILMGPYDYMVNHPGKDIRSQLIAAFNAWLQVPPGSLDVITKVVGMLHTASLL